MENILILRNNEANHIQTIHYPDGQKSVKIDLEFYDVKTPIKIKCSIKNFAELEVLSCICAALIRYDRIINEIEFMYLFGMRSDRSFTEGEPNYFRDVVAPIINSLPGLKTIFYGHSYLSMNAIVNSSLLNNFSFAQKLNLYNMGFLIGGDKNAPSRMVSGILYSNIKFHKERNFHGIEINLTKDDLDKITHNAISNQITIYDDLCDGGATFIAESKYLREKFPQCKLNLFVIHGLFTKGIDHVAEHFDHIFMTNSYQHIDHPKVTVFDVFSGEN